MNYTDRCLCDALRLVRIYHDVGIQYMAEKIQHSRGYLSDIERQKRVPSRTIVRAYAKMFNFHELVLYEFGMALEQFEEGMDPIFRARCQLEAFVRVLNNCRTT